MCPNSIFSRLSTAAAAAGLVVLLARPAAAEDLRIGRLSVLPPSSATLHGPSLSTFANSSLAIGYVSPAYGTQTVALPTAPRALGGMTGGLGLLRAFETGGSYTAPVSIGRIGVFGSTSERPSLLALTPSSSWSIGGSVGLGGFYLRAGVNEVAAIGPLLGLQGAQAGFGYETGDLDLRVTYLTSQGVGSAEREIDSKQWSIGGIYNITSRIRLNADAFYGVGDTRGSALAVQPPSASSAPPGTGARVGVQLRF